MLPYIVTFITYKDAFNDHCPTIEEVQDFLHSFHTPHLIQALGKLNIVLWKEHANIRFQLKIAKLFFEPKELKNLQKALLSRRKHIPFLFHRQQILLAMKVVLLNPNLEGTREVDLNKLGRYLLAINEHLETVDNSFNIDLTESLRYESARQSIAKLQYFSHYGDFIHNFARAIEMWLNIPQTERGKSLLKQFNIDIYKEFVNTTGLSIEEYICINFLNLHHLYELDVHTKNPQDFLLFGDFFSKTKLSKEKVKKLYKPLIQSINDFRKNYETTVKDYLRSKDKFESNFLALNEYPIVKINENMFIVTDPQYLERRITEGPYWILLNYFDQKGERTKGRGRDLSSYFGILHQEYIYQSLEHICDEVIEIPASNEEKLCDFVGVKYIKGEIYLFVIEAKKIALSLSMELNSDRDTTINNLKEIFYEKGFRQIFNTIQKIQNKELNELIKFDLQKVKHIFPLLITDRFIAEETLNRKLYEKEFFEPLLAEVPLKFIPHITHPLFVSAEEIDKIEAILEKHKDTTLVDILGARHNVLIKRYDREEFNQFIPNMEITGVYNLVDHLDNFWNFLFSMQKEVSKNDRLKTIFDKQMIIIKKVLF